MCSFCDRKHKAFDGTYVYLVSLEGHLPLDHSNPATSKCISSAVCQQQDKDPSYQRSLGSFASRKYYLNGEKLENFLWDKN
jgi:hypothetical protein